MGMRTNAILTALNYYFNNKLEQEKQRRDDQRRLKNIEDTYRLNQNLEREYNPLGVEARDAGLQKQIDDFKRYQDNKPLIDSNYNQKLVLEGQELANKSDDIAYAIANKEADRKAAAEAAAAERAYKLANTDLIRAKTWGIYNDAKNQQERLAADRAYKNKILALKGMNLSQGGGAGRAGGLNPAKFIELMKERRAIVEEINRTSIAYENIQKDYTKDPHYQMLMRSLDIIDKQLGEISPEADAAALAKTKESLSGIGSSTDKLVKDQFSGKGEKPKPKSDKTSAIEKALPKEKPPTRFKDNSYWDDMAYTWNREYDERGLLGKIDDYIAAGDRAIIRDHLETLDDLNNRTDDYYKTNKPYGMTGKPGRDLYNFLRKSRDKARWGAHALYELLRN